MSDPIPAANPMIAEALSRGEDATGLCTVRECVQFIHESGTALGLLAFVHQGVRYSVGVSILEAVRVQ